MQHFTFKMIPANTEMNAYYLQRNDFHDMSRHKKIVLKIKDDDANSRSMSKG